MSLVSIDESDLEQLMSDWQKLKPVINELKTTCAALTSEVVRLKGELAKATKARDEESKRADSIGDDAYELGAAEERARILGVAAAFMPRRAHQDLVAEVAKGGAT